MQLYSVFDSLAERWHVPYAMESDAVAGRAFIASVGQADSPMASSPGDYTLFTIGHFDPDTGQVTGETSPIRVMSALEAFHILKAAKAEEDGRQLSLVSNEGAKR